MTEESQLVRDWFFPQASIPSYYGGGAVMEEEETKALKKHLRRCKTVWVTEPRVGHIGGFAGDDPDDQILGIVAKVGCKCGRYATDWKVAELFISGDLLLRDLLDQVKEGKRS